MNFSGYIRLLLAGALIEKPADHGGARQHQLFHFLSSWIGGVSRPPDTNLTGGTQSTLAVPECQKLSNFFFITTKEKRAEAESLKLNSYRNSSMGTRPRGAPENQLLELFFALHYDLQIHYMQKSYAT